MPRFIRLESSVAFDFDDVLPTVRAAAPGASIEEAEDAIQTAVVEHLAKGVPLTAANVVQRARSRLLSARTRRDNRNASLDAFAERGVDEAPVEFAIDEVDFDTHVELREVRDNPILAVRAQRIESGGANSLRRTGHSNSATIYPDAVVEQVRALRRQGQSYPSIAEAVAVPRASVEAWCRGESRCSPSGGGWTRETILAAFRFFAREEGRRPRHSDLRDPRLPWGQTLERVMGTVSMIVISREAGIDVGDEQASVSRPQPRWSRGAILDAYGDFYAEHGRWPKSAERRRDNGLPGMKATARVLGTTSIPMIAAMVETRRS